MARPIVAPRGPLSQRNPVDQRPTQGSFDRSLFGFIWPKSLTVSRPLEYTRVPDNALASPDLHRHYHWVVLLQPVGSLK